MCEEELKFAGYEHLGNVYTTAQVQSESSGGLSGSRRLFPVPGPGPDSQPDLSQCL